jgi:hypothetical protein
MRTADSMFDLGYHPVLIEDSAGVVMQHLVEEYFESAYYPETGKWAPFHREDAWWDHRMTQTINPDTIVFPVTVVWERT